MNQVMKDRSIADKCAQLELDPKLAVEVLEFEQAKKLNVFQVTPVQFLLIPFILRLLMKRCLGMVNSGASSKSTIEASKAKISP